jgi:hypothetical protein
VGARFSTPLAAAQPQLGVIEKTGRNDGLPFERYVKEINAGRIKHVPWCAYFVVWCYHEAGIVIPGNAWKLGSVDYLEGQARLHGEWAKARHVLAWHKFRVDTGWPAPSDIVFFGDRGDSDSKLTGRHCGLVEFARGDKVITIEGNKSNRVKRGSYRLDDPRITGYGRFHGSDAASDA